MFAVAVQTRTARRKGESQKLYAAKETGFDNRAPLWERRIPQYDAMKDPSGSRRPRRRVGRRIPGGGPPNAARTAA